MNRIPLWHGAVRDHPELLVLKLHLPAIGTVLLLLGFRALRRENRWLGGCFAVTVIRAACFSPR